jgi:hypothetical protein
VAAGTTFEGLLLQKCDDHRRHGPFGRFGRQHRLSDGHIDPLRDRLGSSVPHSVAAGMPQPGHAGLEGGSPLTVIFPAGAGCRPDFNQALVPGLLEPDGLRARRHVFPLRTISRGPNERQDRLR